jgi:hypothetical protein
MNMATFRMLPPTGICQLNRIVNGRTYSSAPGAAIDIVDFDAGVLSANGWVKVALTGPTSARPSTNPNGTPPYLATAGLHYVDTTLDKVVVFDGATWRDPLTGSAV